MSRDVMGDVPDGDPTVEPGGGQDHLEVDADLDAGPAPGHRVGRRTPTRWIGLLARAPRRAAATVALLATGLGWFAPELLAAAAPPPPRVVAVASTVDVQYDASNDSALSALLLQVAVVNLGPSRVTVTGVGDLGAQPQLAPVAVGRGGTGRATLRVTSTCLDPTDQVSPRLRATDDSGATAEVPLVGARGATGQFCRILAVQRASPLDGGDPQLAGPATQDGERLVLSLATSGGRRVVLTGVSADEVTLRLRSAPVTLDGTPRPVVLEPLQTCPTSWLTRGPSTTLLLSIRPSPAPNSGPSAAPADPGYQVSVQGGSVVVDWVLRTACPSGRP